MVGSEVIAVEKQGSEDFGMSLVLLYICSESETMQLACATGCLGPKNGKLTIIVTIHERKFEQGVVYESRRPEQKVSM